MNKIPSLTIWINSICAGAAVGSELLADPAMMNLFPPKVAHIITALALTAIWIRSHKNIFVNPDGSSSTLPYPRTDPTTAQAMKKP